MSYLLTMRYTSFRLWLCMKISMEFPTKFPIVLVQVPIWLEGPGQVEEVRNFVRDNAQRLLTVEQALVYPVSARQALQAKLSALLEDGTVDVARLSEDPLWTTSGFKELEEFIFGFMGASSERGAERLRLKLETPLGISVALLAACDQQLAAEAFKAESDLKALEDVLKQLQRFEEAMLNGAILQRQRTLAVVSARFSSFMGNFLFNITWEVGFFTF